MSSHAARGHAYFLNAAAESNTMAAAVFALPELAAHIAQYLDCDDLVEYSALNRRSYAVARRVQAQKNYPTNTATGAALSSPAELARHDKLKCKPPAYLFREACAHGQLVMSQWPPRGAGNA